MTYIYRSLVIRCLVVKIEHLQVTVDVVTLKKSHANNSVTQLSKFTKLIYKGPFFSSSGLSRETQN